jgi:hypothetical protein
MSDKKAFNFEKARLKRLTQYKDCDETVLNKAVEKCLAIKNLVEEGQFINDAEKKLAEKSFREYLEQNEFENYSDLKTLSILVYSEILSIRLQKSINACSDDGKSYISEKLLKSFSDLSNQILNLKKDLGIDREKIEDEMTALSLLKKRYAQHILENRAEYTLYVPFKCVGCGKEDVAPYLLRLRVKDYEVLKHPFFAGRFTYNAEIIKDVQEKKITVEMAARYLEVSPLYIEWCLQNLGRILPNK